MHVVGLGRGACSSAFFPKRVPDFACVISIHNDLIVRRNFRIGDKSVRTATAGSGIEAIENTYRYSQISFRFVSLFRVPESRAEAERRTQINRMSTFSAIWLPWTAFSRE
jgi:hypothetical protein